MTKYWCVNFDSEDCLKHGHAQRSHDHKNRFVFFTDAPTLYEDFTDKWRQPGDRLSRYAQRIDVEVWQHIAPECIEMKGLLKYILKKPYLAVTEIDEAFFRRIEKQLRKSQSSSFKAGSSSEVDEVPEDVVLEALEHIHAKSQGFQLDSKLRKAIEDHAMEAATKRLTSLGYSVKDHSKNHSYDLLCRKKKERLHVEVKGTVTSGDGIILTSGEVTFARNHKGEMGLFILHSIQVSADGNVSEGKQKVIVPWDVDDGKLKPIAFNYEVP